MTSDKQAAANRINGRKSRGPRTGAGKARASRNAFRHGLASFSAGRDSGMAEQIEEVVGAICAGDPLLREQAVMIAENRVWRSLVRAQKIALIERLRNPKALPLSPAQRKERAELQRYVKDWIAKRRAAGHTRKHELPPRELDGAPPVPAAKRKKSKRTEQDDHDALRGALNDLMRLLRYERSAWSRQKKAVRGFMAIKFANFL